MKPYIYWFFLGWRLAGKAGYAKPTKWNTFKKWLFLKRCTPTSENQNFMIFSVRGECCAPFLLFCALAQAKNDFWRPRELQNGLQNQKNRDLEKGENLHFVDPGMINFAGLDLHVFYWSGEPESIQVSSFDIFDFWGWILCTKLSPDIKLKPKVWPKRHFLRD